MKNDGNLDQPRPAKQNIDLHRQPLTVGITGFAHFPDELAGAVHGASEAVGQGKQQQADAGNQDDRPDGDLQDRDEFSESCGRHGFESANARQLFAAGHVENPLRADGAFQ